MMPSVHFIDGNSGCAQDGVHFNRCDKFGGDMARRCGIAEYKTQLNDLGFIPSFHTRLPL